METNNKSHRFCVIMCGGIGSRFWPYSRTACPKQFIDFLGLGRSLLQMSYDRMLPLVPPENMIVVTNEAYAPLVREQLPDILPSNILCEPARRNTAPCIAWAAWHINAIDPEAVMVVTPSDHLITREQAFTDALTLALDYTAANKALLTLGIKPSRPETGYGYIQIGTEEVAGLYKVKTFTEKPDLQLAKVFLETGEFVWNSGIFIWSARTIIDALATYAPDLNAIFEAGAEVFGTPDEAAFIARDFTSCPNISIDYAVMEKARNVYVEPVDIGWSDLGTWSSLHDNSPKNRDRNVAHNCRLLAYDSTDNIFAIKQDKLVVVDSLDGYIVADTGDVLLICPKAHEQTIKQMVNDAKAKFGDKYL